MCLFILVGLEYRIITGKEQVSASEFVSIYKEVIRLFTVYGDNYSFAKYSSNFINYLRALRTGLITAYDLQYPISNKKVREALAPNTEISVAKKIADSEPIDAELAWAWFKDVVVNLQNTIRQTQQRVQMVVLFDI